ncbi:receptor-type tyrosine-protein phosphatase H-like [Cyprinodon tularosa]|uniref:receptor-type tyrosine-protein phosphatase H-like n=1 Tax=Cyprinodon tularosa TaxID=77115 RepID=UPI0018E24F1A|nr:receptor-type tyrosine-protein phosphatase H-like [Cyprinodon tularosa]
MRWAILEADSRESITKMKLLSFKFKLDLLLLCVSFSLLWIVADCNNMSELDTTNKTELTIRVETTPRVTTTIKPANPADVRQVNMVRQNESSITLEWDKVDNILTYRLKMNGGDAIDVTGTADDIVNYVVSGLTAGTRYSFILYTVLHGISSSGYSFTAVTAPSDAKEFKHINQTETSITLQWTKVGDIKNYTLKNDGTKADESFSEDNGIFTVIVPHLTSGTRYSFTLYNVFDYAESKGISITAVTAPSDAKEFKHINQTETSITLQWTKVGDIKNYTLENDGTKVDESYSEDNGIFTVIVPHLTSGTTYSFTLYNVFDYAESKGISITAVTAPSDAKEFKHIDQTETSITLQWTKVGDINNYTLKNDETKVDETYSEDNGIYTVIVPHLTSGTTYSFTLYNVFDYAESTGRSIKAVTAPSDTETFQHINQTETSITLQWTKVGDIKDYTLSYNGKDVNITNTEGNGKYTVPRLTSGTRYSFTLYTVFDYARSRGKNITAVTMRDINSYTLSYNGTEVNITHSEGNGKYTVPDLTSGTRYSFTLFTLFGYTRSRGKIITAVTVPSQVSSVNVTERFEDRVTLQWHNQNKEWNYTLTVNDKDMEINQNVHDIVSYSVTNLKPGTKYSFIITTIFSGVLSTPYRGDTVTKINCNSVTWHVTNSSIKGTVEGLFTKATASYNSNTHDSPEGKNVSFTGLYPGATYEISLKYNLASTDLTQCSIKIPIIPPSVTADCSYWASGYGAKINMKPLDGVLTGVEVTINKKTLTINETVIKTGLIVKGLQPAKRYEVSLVSQLEAENVIRRSEPSVFFCSTDNRGVIAGSLVGVLLFVVLICLIVFIVRKRPDLIRRKKSFLSGSQKSDSKAKAIPLDQFPDHFHQLELDENRGFSQEYESLASVGIDQTRNAATVPENKAKNRFTNILPYDWSRVKLVGSNVTSDYINANYLPGYNSNKEYIATQGPLPSTVNDFWRMVWEQKVRRIVMVTNCIEAGRTKCEQYWPEDRKQCRYGELTVSKKSEEKESNWIQREFTLKHSNDPEQRTVKHFHFTAWPDHGVPTSTEVLIRFRRLMRQHIESEGSKAPTVVHCSAGVGRTGTIIALDVLLQQLQREEKVGIKGFVEKMRRHRSHMVQTESQYVFLHQCIMDSLQLPETQEENVYENDHIYVNATALKNLR